MPNKPPRERRSAGGLASRFFIPAFPLSSAALPAWKQTTGPSRCHPTGSPRGSIYPGEEAGRSSAATSAPPAGLSPRASQSPGDGRGGGGGLSPSGRERERPEAGAVVIGGRPERDARPTRVEETWPCFGEVGRGQMSKRPSGESAGMGVEICLIFRREAMLVSVFVRFQRGGFFLSLCPASWNNLRGGKTGINAANKSRFWNRLAFLILSLSSPSPPPIRQIFILPCQKRYTLVLSNGKVK